MTSVAQGSQKGDGAEHGRDELTVKVFSPRVPDPKEFTWPKNKLVGEAAREAANAFNQTGGTPGFQNSDKHVLDNAKRLVAEGVREGDTLELIDTTGGV
jgi:hypothetical protein